MTSTQVEIGQQLVFMDRQDVIDRFDFDKNRFLNNEIGPIAAIETNAFIYPGQHNLPLKSQTRARKLERETILIKTLKKSWSDRLMNLDRHPNHSAGQIPGDQPNHLFSALSGHSASSGFHGASPQHKRPHHPQKV